MRRHARGWVVAYAFAAGAIVSLAPLLALRFPASWVVPALGALALSGLGALVLLRLRRLRRAVCSVAISPFSVAVVDYGGRTRRLRFARLDHVEIGSEGIRLVERDTARAVIVVPGTFPAYTDLGHRLLDIAERYGFPIWVDGVDVMDLDLAGLYPTAANA